MNPETISAFLLLKYFTSNKVFKYNKSNPGACRSVDWEMAKHSSAEVIKNS